MIQHSLQIIMRNKLKNGLLILQFSLSFVALLLLIKEAYYNIDNMTMNIGFEPKGLIGGSISGVWGRVNTEAEFNQLYGELKNALAEVKSMNSVKSAGYMAVYPYAGSNSNSNGFQMNWITVEAFEALELKPIAGKQFSTDHEFSTKKYLMINKNAYEEFKKVEEEPLEQSIFTIMNKLDPDDDVKPDEDIFIAGVFDEFLMRGRYRYVRDFCRLDLVAFENTDRYKDNWGNIGFLSNFVIRLKDGADEMVAMQEIDNIYKKHITNRSTRLISISAEDDLASREPLIRLGIYFFICLVLTYVIVVGIIGITRENISKRILEIGIRAALGSNEKQISKQFFGELTLIAIVSVVLSTLIILLLNLANIASTGFGYIQPIVAFLVLVGIIISCVYNMVTSTSKMRPNVSLHYE